MNDSHFPNQIRRDSITSGWNDYSLIDSGDSMKLERFGERIISRFEPAAAWKPALKKSEWAKAKAEFTLSKGQQSGTWRFPHEMDPSWIISLDKLKFQLEISASRHIGIFPEQLENWRWIGEQVRNAALKIDVLNLFGYTGVASLFAAREGASVTHIDASRKAIETGKNSSLLSNLSHLPVRWIVDDVSKFISREIRRENKYQGIIMDPPRFGRGPQGELWKFDQMLVGLLKQCTKVLFEKPKFFIITAYNVDMRPEDLSAFLFKSVMELSGSIEYGYLIQKDQSADRKIEQAIYARWSSESKGDQ